MNNLTDITRALQILGVAILALTALLLILRLLELILRRLARHHVTSTDLDLIGRRAVVTHTIRPARPGKIYCRNGKGEDCVAEAVSDRVIRRGSDVLITAMENSLLRVLPSPAAPAGKTE